MKTTYKDILDGAVTTSFRTHSKIYDLGKQAEIIGNLAKDSIDKEGKFAKIHCSNVVEWMQEMADIAQKALDIQLEKE